MKKYVLYTDYGILNGKFFVKDYDPENWNLSNSEIRILELGPEHPSYRETWNNIVKSRSFSHNNCTYSLEESPNYQLSLIEVNNVR